jgi:predicted ABC-class ATPase
VYFQLEKMLLELRMKLKKEDPAVLVKGYEELYNKAKEALETAPTDSHLYTLAVCMMTAARNKQILLGKPLEAEEEVAKAVD